MTEREGKAGIPTSKDPLALLHTSTMSTAYSTADVVSTPLVLLDRELKKLLLDWLYVAKS